MIPSLRKDLAHAETQVKTLQTKLTDALQAVQLSKELEQVFGRIGLNSATPANDRQSKKETVIKLFSTMGGCLYLYEVEKALGMTEAQAKRYMNRAIERRPWTCSWRRVGNDPYRFVLKDWSKVTLLPQGWEAELKTMRAKDDAKAGNTQAATQPQQGTAADGSTVTPSPQ
jgi:hypothetical protein